MAVGCDQDGVFTLGCQAAIYGGGCPVILPKLHLIAALHKNRLNSERLVHLRAA